MNLPGVWLLNFRDVALFKVLLHIEPFSIAKSAKEAQSSQKPSLRSLRTSLRPLRYLKTFIIKA